MLCIYFSTKAMYEVQMKNIVTDTLYYRFLCPDCFAVSALIKTGFAQIPLSVWINKLVCFHHISYFTLKINPLVLTSRNNCAKSGLK